MADITDGTSNTLALGERGIREDFGWGWPICGGTECEQYISSERGLTPNGTWFRKFRKCSFFGTVIAHVN